MAFFDDLRHTRSRVHGIPVVGDPERIAELSHGLRLDELIIAMPSAPPKRTREVVHLIQEAGLPCRTVPSLDQLATGRVSVSVLRPVEIQDLLGRAPVQIEMGRVWRSLRGRTVMVTGAGGSIGSELCRQILTFGPKKLLLVERSEPQLFLIEQELRALVEGDVVEPLIGDITRPDRMREIFRRFQPEVVFHAAAHKHVPLMEHQPEEAIRNNIFGTALLADLAAMRGVPDEKRTARFVCVMVLCDPRRTWAVTRGTIEGRIAHAPAGSGGFGYDPLFYLPDRGRTSAQLTAEQKNAISHRGNATRAMLKLLQRIAL